ncbi:MAG: hypothetical protein U5K99_06450 [Anaerolineales bacterium]|nr:hypothetical protein [Anaerolineales bacterium]
MNYSTRDLVTLAVFGTLWGISEMTLGTVLKSLRIPISGVILAAIGLTIALIGRVFVPQKGSVLFIGVIAALLKLFTLGGVVIGPMVGIITEAAVAEAVLSLKDRPNRGIMVLAGGAGVLWVLVQPFITNPLLFGRGIVDVWLDLLRSGSRLLGLGTNTVLWIVAGLVIIYFLIGALAGWTGWTLGGQLYQRLGRSGVEFEEKSSSRRKDG